MTEDNDRPGPATLKGSVDEAIAELRSGETRGFYLVTSNGARFTEVYHDLEPAEWDVGVDIPYSDATRQLLLGYALSSLESDADQDILETAIGLVHAAALFQAAEREVEYHTALEELGTENND